MRVVRLKTSQIAFIGTRRAQCMLQHRPCEAQAKDCEAERCKLFVSGNTRHSNHGLKTLLGGSRRLYVGQPFENFDRKS